MISCTLPYSEHMLNMDSNVTTDADSSICRPTNYELLHWLVETPSRDFEHYRMTDDSRQSIIQHFHVRRKCRKIDRPTFSRYVKCRTIGFARWRFNLFECRRRMLRATCWTGLNERNSVRQIVDRSYKYLTKNHILSSVSYTHLTLPTKRIV